MSTAAANWYPDPNDANQVRYWDGVAWTNHTAPRPVGLVPPSPFDQPMPAPPPQFTPPQFTPPPPAAPPSWPSLDSRTSPTTGSRWPPTPAPPPIQPMPPMPPRPAPLSSDRRASSTNRSMVWIPLAVVAGLIAFVVGFRFAVSSRQDDAPAFTDVSREVNRPTDGSVFTDSFGVWEMQIGSQWRVQNLNANDLKQLLPNQPGIGSVKSYQGWLVGINSGAVNVVSESVPKSVSLNNYLSESQKKSPFPITYKVTTINGQKFGVADGTVTASGASLRTRAYVLLKDGKAVVATAGTTALSFESFWSSVEPYMATLRIR